MGASDAGVLDIADNGDAQRLEVALVAANGVHVEHRLGGVGVAPVAGVDDADMGLDMAGDEMSRAAVRMAHDEHVYVHGFKVAQGIEQGLALVGGGGLDVEVEHVGGEAFFRQLEGGAGAGAVFEEEVDDRPAVQQGPFFHDPRAAVGEGVGGGEDGFQGGPGQTIDGEEVAQTTVWVQLEVCGHGVGRVRGWLLAAGGGCWFKTLQ